MLEPLCRSRAPAFHSLYVQVRASPQHSTHPEVHHGRAAADSAGVEPGLQKGTSVSQRKRDSRMRGKGSSGANPSNHLSLKKSPKKIPTSFPPSSLLSADCSVVLSSLSPSLLPPPLREFPAQVSKLECTAYTLCICLQGISLSFS